MCTQNTYTTKTVVEARVCHVHKQGGVVPQIVFMPHSIARYIPNISGFI